MPNLGRDLPMPPYLSLLSPTPSRQPCTRLYTEPRGSLSPSRCSPNPFSLYLPWMPLACTIFFETGSPARVTSPLASPYREKSNPHPLRDLSASYCPLLSVLCELTKHRTPGGHIVVVSSPSRPSFPGHNRSPGILTCLPQQASVVRAPLFVPFLLATLAIAN
jgi:hypothetical protein